MRTDTVTEEIRSRCLRAVSPLTSGDPDRYFYGERTVAGRSLPPYYLVYFLLRELLGFPLLGKQEKVAWSIVVEYNEKPFVLEHRKLGFGLFAHSKDDPDGDRVVRLISNGVKEAVPFYKSKAEQALDSSEINVLQRSHSLYDRFAYLTEVYDQHRAEAEQQRDVVVKTPIEGKGFSGESVSFPYYDLRQKAVWIGTSVIEAFFSWTEHYFIHLALLRGTITSAREVVELAEDEWSAKFKKGLDLTGVAEKQYYDRLLLIRRQVRNFVAHGAFGKSGEAFDFHSPVGAVPVYVERTKGGGTVSLSGGLTYDDDDAINCIREFADFLKKRPYAEPFKYAHEGQFPTILTYVRNGTYSAAVQSAENMDDLIETMNDRHDYHANMDW